MVKSFCKDCPNRHTICHDTCPQYQKYKQELKAENAYNQAMTMRTGIGKKAASGTWERTEARTGEADCKQMG